MIVEPGKTYVRRLRAVSAERDALALRLRLERALAAADFHPPGLPATAVLCVRRLTGLRAHALLAREAGAYALSDWQRAVAEAVEQLARHAASPARGAVPANAEAVIFRDQAELLACLAADCCDEAAPARWWWQSLFGGRSAAAAMLAAWLEAPEHVPAALGRLASAGRLVAFARRLGDEEARALRRIVVHKFGLRELHAALEAPDAGEERRSPRGVAEATGETDEGRADVSSQARPKPAPAPWERDAPELRGHSLGREQACLAGVGLMLLRAPSRVRSPSFARLVADWRSGAPAPFVGAVDAPSATHAPEASTPSEAGDAEALPARVVERGDRIVSKGVRIDVRGNEVERLDDAPAADAPRGVGPEKPASKESARQAPAADARPAESASSAGGERLRDVSGAEAHRAPGGPRVGGRAAVEVAPEPDESEEPAPVYEARIQTAYGGLFYLINVGLRLNLYGDFTTPLSPGLPLPIWDFLALLGRRLCGEGVEGDAVWPLLARLAGRREGEPPGHDFTPEDSWRVPPDWLAPFAGDMAEAWEWAAGGGRLRVRHPEGFLVLDAPLVGRQPARAVERRLAEELKAYEGGGFDFTLRRAGAEDFGGPCEDSAGALERWLDWLTPYVAARLRRALGADAVAGLLCEHAARVAVTETRLDVTFSLARLPVAVRLSGLDRDPGWTPAAGRRVAFHYE